MPQSRRVWSMSRRCALMMLELIPHLLPMSHAAPWHASFKIDPFGSFGNTLSEAWAGTALPPLPPEPEEMQMQHGLTELGAGYQITKRRTRWNRPLWKSAFFTSTTGRLHKDTLRNITPLPSQEPPPINVVSPRDCVSKPEFRHKS